MCKKILALPLLFSLLFVFSFETPAKMTNKNNNFGIKNYPYIQNEKLVILALQKIFAAQVAVSAIFGGNYGSLDGLQNFGLIDSVLASGSKYGYSFNLFKTNQTATTPSRFYVTATPRNYRKTGRKSFYIDESGFIRGTDRSGTAATVTDPVIETTPMPSPIPDYETQTILNLRTLHSAQLTYQATVGNGNFGTFQRLFHAGLIDQRLAVGVSSGYFFTCVTNDFVTGSPAFFKFSAVPVNYRATGIRSFYIDVNGIMRGADKNGASADANDPPIE